MGEGDDFNYLINIFINTQVRGGVVGVEKYEEEGGDELGSDRGGGGNLTDIIDMWGSGSRCGKVWRGEADKVGLDRGGGGDLFDLIHMQLWEGAVSQDRIGEKGSISST